MSRLSTTERPLTGTREPPRLPARLISGASGRSGGPRMKCSRCQQDNPSHANFCLTCGVPLRSTNDSIEAPYAELQRALTEAREQQTATGEILRVIASSPTNLQPVLDAVAQSAARLCDAYDAGVFRVDGNVLRLAAHHGPLAAPAGLVVPLIRGSAAGRAVIERRTFQVADLQAEVEEFPEGSGLARRFGYRTTLNVPLVREGVATGVIVIRRSEVRPFAGKQVELVTTFADQAVIAIENVRLFTELKARNKDLTDALQRETAAGEVLRLISSSPTDIAPVFDGILRSALRLAAADYGATLVRDGEFLHLVASSGTTSEWDKVAENLYPLRANPDHLSWQAIMERRPVFIEDAQGSPLGGVRDLARTMGYRSLLMVPMLRQDAGIGVLALVWQEARAFPSEQLPLLQTFADQAVIAIENVRLFKELEARNRDLTATSEILQVISRSPTDVQPIFDTIAERAMQLCSASFGAVFMFDGDLIHLSALANVRPDGVDALRKAYPRIPSQGGNAGRVILLGDVVEIPDVLADPDYQLTGAAAAAGFRSTLGVPMLHQGRPIGVIVVSRPEPGAFSGEQIQLLRTFADQAVIAIENVRLFTELQASNRELRTALDTQTATSEILGVISQAHTDIHPVFDVIADSAARLLQADMCGLFRVENGQLHQISSWSRWGPELENLLGRGYPRPLDTSTYIGQAILQRRVIHSTDMNDPATPSAIGLQRFGFRSQISAPMLRGDEPIGGLSVARRTPGPFSDDEIKLLKTFTDQALIAIENVRLFRELHARTRELTRSVDELTALGDVGRALSSTLDLETVLQTIVTRANELAGTDGGSIYEYDEEAEVFRLRASSWADPREAETLEPIGRATPIPRGQGAASRAAALRQPTQIPDIGVEGAYESPIRGPLLQAGYRAILTVPLLLEDRVIGALSISRKMPGEFAPEIVRLLSTFATQSALAIQNARLFREIEQKSRELEAASRHKSEFLANMSHELRTPLNAIIGFSEVLSERMFGELNERQEEDLKDIHASGQHLLSLINDILDLSQIEAGRMELELTDFHVPSAIENALTLFRERASRRGITLGHEISNQVATIRGDERKVKQVLLNLLSNALKFTPEGGRVNVRASLHDGLVDISVTDTGVGIAPEDQEKVFEEFRQVGTADTKVEGTGLGLALSRKFIELHSGRIWVQSQPGKGSTFSFTLPAR